ncbi:MAG: hypothetical protein Q9162_006279 [Coniocarpon cinnabarinum]
MTSSEAGALRDETIDLFYHGYDHYMKFAFPEDELKPISCLPLSRDKEDEGHFELNDVLGNYSLTLVDSLSTLAIFASSQADVKQERKPLRDFQDGIKAVVKLYGDGTPGAGGQGTRARGFDLDSKVQVFETVIRGVGGLLSAHLFAVGELPIRGYEPSDHSSEIHWSNGFVYNGQLLRLATDLATRLLPAFHTATDLPYPRVNLRHGVPFYPNSPFNVDGENGVCELASQGHREITETCSAGAGSLVMEFSVLSRLTGDMRFERVATKAFDAVWKRRSDLGLVGAGIDAESGEWVSPITGASAFFSDYKQALANILQIGAGVDSFFEYAMKAHILLARTQSGFASNESSPSDYYLSVWQLAHDQNRHHLMRGPAFQHPHYVQGDMHTGAARAFWLDSLSAYYPGLLALSGNVDEAIDVHLLFAALWTRYSSLPERWNAVGGSIDSGLRWWGGRPEFIESSWYLYRATQDPWYLRVGEMILADIRKRCWTECGWAGLEDVRTGELKDRMESFFLGETAKYLFLLFDRDHPLNTLEAPWVMSTEGHPLILPKTSKHAPTMIATSESVVASAEQCQVAPTTSALIESLVVSRPNFFHAASLARLHFTPFFGRDINASLESSHLDTKYNTSSRISRNHNAFYPWTLPEANLPHNATSAKMQTKLTFELTFPLLPNTVNGIITAKRIPDGISINSVSGLKFSMIKEPQPVEAPDGRIIVVDVFRIHSINHLSLGREERVVINTDAIANLNPIDPYFTRHRDITAVDLVLDVGETLKAPDQQSQELISRIQANNTVVSISNGTLLNNVLYQLNSAFQSSLTIDDILASAQSMNNQTITERPVLYSNVAVGAGAAPVPDLPDASPSSNASLSYTTIYLGDQACEGRLDPSVPKENQVIIFKRGGCSFAEKLRSIPSFAPSEKGLQLVVVFSDVRENAGGLIRPLLDQVQTTVSGVVRRKAVPLVMVEGDEALWEILRRTRGLGLRRKYYFSCQGVKIGNLWVV